MNKQLLFEIKQNQKKTPKVYIRERETRTILGSFSFEAIPQQDAWNALPSDYQNEIQQFINNIQAIYPYMNAERGYQSEDLRFRLPNHLMQALSDTTTLFQEEGKNFDFYTPMTKSIIQALLVAEKNISTKNQDKMDVILSKAGLLQGQSTDFAQQNNAIFTALCKIHNKSERLHQKAIELFQKDKSYSPKSLENMAKGEMTPQKWLKACAIAILIEEKVNLSAFLSEDDIFLLFAKPLLDQGYLTKDILALLRDVNLPHLKHKLEEYGRFQKNTDSV